jgi:Leucine-rich repeat (LRR) protein
MVFSPLILHLLPLEVNLNILFHGSSIKDLCRLRATSKDLRLVVNEFVRKELFRLNIQAPSYLSDFLATQESVTSANAWTILGLFKQTYPSLPLNMSIEKAYQELNHQVPTLVLKDELLKQNPGAFANLQLQQTAEEIRNWFSNPINHPLLQEISNLVLDERGIRSTPQDLHLFSRLKKLNLTRNKITASTLQTFANLTDLTSLSLYKNEITSIPPQLFDNLINLTQLTLTFNQITSIPPKAFSNLSNLKLLTLSRNKISVINSESFEGLTHLDSLFLRNNQIEAIDRSTFARLPGLKNLYLSGNKIASIPPKAFTNLLCLEKLDLSENKISTVSANAFANLTNLQRLNLSQNQLTAIDAQTFANLANLRWLFLEMNPMNAGGPIDRAHLGLAEGVTIETTIQLDKLDCF